MQLGKFITGSKAERMITLMEALGAEDAEDWVRSEINEGIPQMATFILLRGLWKAIDDWRDRSEGYVPGMIENAQSDPTDAFADAGLAMQRMVEVGVSPRDIGAVARMVAYETAFVVLNRIDECYDYETDIEGDLPGWRLMETTPEGELTGREIGGLHESLLGLDPSGLEDRPQEKPQGSHNSSDPNRRQVWPSPQP